jgi:hypothetical protein
VGLSILPASAGFAYTRLPHSVSPRAASTSARRL